MKWLLVVFVAALFLYGVPVVTNTVTFHPDEMYWIGSGQIIPLLYKRDTTNPFWNEYYGYANFNGAKLLYGFGLTILGHTDYQAFGLPPATYYQFEPFGGKPFPVHHFLYTMVRDGRLISALFAAASVGLMFWWVYVLLGNIMGGVLSAVVFALLHPNFIFYPTRGPVQIIADRMRITRDHMIYFDAHEPGHVLWDIPSRIGSLYRQIFVWPWLLPVCIAGVWLTMRTKQKIMHFVAASALAILIGTLGIVVFDEGRYYLPILPFISLLAGGSTMALYAKK